MTTVFLIGLDGKQTSYLLDPLPRNPLIDYDNKTITVPKEKLGWWGINAQGIMFVERKRTHYVSAQNYLDIQFINDDKYYEQESL